ESVNDLDDLINNINFTPIMATEPSSLTLDQDSNIEILNNLVNDNDDHDMIILNYNDIFKYCLGYKDGTLNNLYCAGEIELLGVQEFPELKNIPTNYISVREAA
ncbi:18183_t:CDS:2, partial [Racocetra persica]